MPTLNPFSKLPRGREIWAWGMYDLANQSFQLLVDTLLLPIYFTTFVALTPESGRTPAQADTLWGWLVGAAMLLVVVVSPGLGALADARLWKKSLLIGTGLLAVPLTAALAALGPGMIWQAAAIYITAKMLVGLGENFLGSFLPELSTPATVGKVSALGWAMSYLGALILLGVTAFVVFALKADQPRQWRWMFLFAAAWFLLGMVPSMLLLRENRAGKTEVQGSIGGTFVGSFVLIGRTIREARRFPQLVRFLFVFFIYSLGTNTVVFFLGIIGKRFGFGIRDLTLMALIMALTAGASAVLIGRLQDRIGHRSTIVGCLIAWIVSTLALGLMNYIPGLDSSRSAFWVIAGGLGVALGGIGTASRALVGAFTPESKSGEFFGLWGMVYKLAGVVGPLVFAKAGERIGQGNSLFVLTAFFAAGLVLLFIVDERRGMDDVARTDAGSSREKATHAPPQPG